MVSNAGGGGGGGLPEFSVNKTCRGMLVATIEEGPLHYSCGVAGEGAEEGCCKRGRRG